MQKEYVMSVKKIAAYIVISVVLFLISCTTTGPGGDKSFVILPTSAEISIGQGMAEEVAKTEKKLPDEQWQSYLNEVGQKIVKVCDRQDLEYTFTVIESDQINAFAAPGGYVYFYTGLLREMKTEAEMAAVMAHEISHVVARHSAKQIQTSMGAQLAYALVFGGKEQSQARDLAVNLGMALAMSGYSRDMEREADKFGGIYMVKAGYNPNGMVSMLETLARLGGSGGSSFEQLLSSHPDTQERIKNAKKEVTELSPLDPNLTFGQQRYQQMLARLPK
jgi:predicted Zn-dependent protease